jgi:thiamine-monophosphate kinase
VEGVYAGLEAALGRYGGTLLGGDCSGGEQRVLAVSALGRLGPDGPIRRADGRAGDALISTGPHGLSRLGLAVVRQDPAGPAEADWRLASRSLLEEAVSIHRRPRPRLDAVAALVSTRPADCPWRVGGTDSSDGLAAAVTALARSSGCDALLERDRLPLPGEMAAWPQGERWCLSGGEDFELVLALEPDWAEALSDHLPGARRIGWLAPGAGVVRWASDGAALGSESQGYTHFH